MTDATTLPPPVASISPHNGPVPSETGILDNNQLLQLEAQGFSRGLSNALAAYSKLVPLRIWVIDNSGSMSNTDGHRFEETKESSDVKVVPCSRWNEIQETAAYHAEMAALLRAPTVFRMLNAPDARIGPAEFGVADKGEGFLSDDLQMAHGIILNTPPSGATPLARHVEEIRERILPLAPQLQAEGKKIAIIFATDGVPTSGTTLEGDPEMDQFVYALRTLEGLPVSIVIRLCTDDDSVVQFYNSLDSKLELNIEVLDDFIGEAQEIHANNNWVNYTLPLHRCREMGLHNRLLDLLDERLLTRTELKDYCIFVLGDDQSDMVPDPDADLDGFLETVRTMAKKEKKQWNPVKKKMTRIVLHRQIKTSYGKTDCTIM